MNTSLKIPSNKIVDKHGKAYYMELKHIIMIKQKYNICIDRKPLNNKYGIKQYNKQ